MVILLSEGPYLIPLFTFPTSTPLPTHVHALFKRHIVELEEPMSGLVNEEKLKQMGAQPPLGDSNSEDGALVITA